jgi:hypothetical protein
MTSLYATTPENPNELKADDEIMGVEAIQNLHSKFRKYKKIKEKENLQGEEPKYPLVEYINATDMRMILPKSIGLVNKSPSVENNYALESVRTIFVGKEYAEPFSEGIKVVNKVKELNVSKSDLHNDMLLPILKKVPLSLEALNVSYNYNLTSKVYKNLCGILDDPQRM